MKDTFPTTFLQEREIIKKILPHLNLFLLEERWKKKKRINTSFSLNGRRWRWVWKKEISWYF